MFCWWDVSFIPLRELLFHQGAETVQVNFFVNNAANEVGSVFEPGLDRDFTNAVQEMLLNQTNLDLTNVNGHLIYEGEIV